MRTKNSTRAGAAAKFDEEYFSNERVIINRRCHTRDWRETS